MSDARITGGFTDRLKEIVVGMITNVEIVYFGDYQKELDRTFLGPVKSGEPIDYVIHSRKGWSGLMFSMNLRSADLVFRNDKGEEILWLSLGPVTVGTVIHVITPVAADMFLV